MAKPRAVIAISLASIAAACAVEPGYIMLTQAEGAPFVEAGDAELVEGVAPEGDKAAVRLTAQGLQKVAGQPEAEPTEEEEAEAVEQISGAAPTGAYAIDTDVPMVGARTGRAGGSKYPFDSLEVGHSFHVPATAEDPNPAKALASSVSAATARYAEEVPGEMETVELNEYEKDADGKRVKNAEGKLIIKGKRTVTRAATRETRKFVVRTVTKTDPKGAGCRVYRTA